MSSKYQRWHDQIIDRARYRDLDCFSEMHHVVPRALGGTDDPANLVTLTYREHFLVHWLLTKICDGQDRALMAFALHCMSFSTIGRIVAAWQFELAKRVLRREYLIRAKQRYELRREARREKIRQAEDAAKRVPELVAELDLQKAANRQKVAALTRDYLNGQFGRTRRQSRKTVAANKKSKLIIAEANRLLSQHQDRDIVFVEGKPKIRSRQAMRPSRLVRLSTRQ